jgi:hypothetical protein
MGPSHGDGNEMQMTEKTFEQFDAAELPNRYGPRVKSGRLSAPSPPPPPSALNGA